MARVVALMPQRPVVPDGISVRELVALGRTPHLRRFGTESATDRDAVERTLDRLDLRRARRPSRRRAVRAASCSGWCSPGRWPRSRRCCCSTSRPAPSTSATSRAFSTWSTRCGCQDELTVVAAMHDLTLAGQYGRRVVLLHRGRVVADAGPAEVLRPARLAEVYGARVEVLQREDGPAVLPVRDRG